VSYGSDIVAHRIALRVVECVVTEGALTYIYGREPLAHPLVQFENLHLGLMRDTPIPMLSMMLRNLALFSPKALSARLRSVLLQPYMLA